MARVSATPHRPLKHPRAEGFVVLLAPLTEPGPRARETVLKLVERRLRGRWEILPLGPSGLEFEIRKPPGKRSPGVRHAWETCYVLREEPEVIAAEPVFVLPGISPASHHVFPAAPPHRPAAGRDSAPLPCAASTAWSLEMCRVPEAWERRLPPRGSGRRYGEGILVAHPDTGYTPHPEIWEPKRLLASQGHDFEDEDPDPRDPLLGRHPGHGTATASVIMSGPDIRTPPGVTGVAPRAALVPLRVSTSVVHLSFSRLARAVYFAAEHGCHVLSMSLGGPIPSAFLRRALHHALVRGVILIAAAGNVWPWVVYPARYPDVVAVAACNCRRRPWRLSAAGPAVDISAPGESVWRARPARGKPGYRVAPSSGTSYAAAMVAGASALWLATHGRRRLLQRYGRAGVAAVFRETLCRHGVDTPAGWRREKFGAGILNVLKLLEAPIPPDGTGVRRDPAPAETPLDTLAVYFPGLDPGQLREALARCLQAHGRALDRALHTFGDELVFHVGTNPGFRRQLEHLARKPRALKTRGPAGDKAFQGQASRALIQQMTQS